MHRDYTDGAKDNVEFFTGIEIEKTPAYGMKTLFVVGVHNPDKIIEMARVNDCKHVFVGANHSFDLTASKEEDWEGMILPLLRNGMLVTLDFDVKVVESVLESGYVEYDNFIPQISVKIPFIKQFNYNTMLKIDDKDFKASNPGVWCHRLHDLMDTKCFTDWREYGKDEPL